MSTWRCHRSGDCCRTTPHVLMSTEERRIVEEAAPVDVRMVWRKAEREGFWELRAQPCPLLTYDGAGKASCSIYVARPYECRRFACYRDDVKREPFDLNAIEHKVISVRSIRRDYQRRQRKAQVWALDHGWTGQET